MRQEEVPISLEEIEAALRARGYHRGRAPESSSARYLWSRKEEQIHLHLYEYDSRELRGAFPGLPPRSYELEAYFHESCDMGLAFSLKAYSISSNDILGVLPSAEVRVLAAMRTLWSSQPTEGIGT